MVTLAPAYWLVTTVMVVAGHRRSSLSMGFNDRRHLQEGGVDPLERNLDPKLPHWRTSSLP